MITLYQKLPPEAKNIIKYIYSLLPLQKQYGKRFFKQLEFLEQSQWWSKQEFENYQNEQLRKLVAHAYANVPYYNRLFKESHLTTSDIKTVHDLNKIPILTKDMVRNNIADFVAVNYRKNQLVHIVTSGTSGKIIDIYCDPVNEFINGGPFEWRFYRWGGWNFDDVCAVLRYSFLKQQVFGLERIYQFNPVQKKVFFSIYDLDESHLDEYLTGFRRYRITVMQGYPTWISKLANLLKHRNCSRPVGLKAIFTIAELLIPEQRKIIEGYFEAKIFDWYGMQERVVIGCECEMHDGHHINSEYGIVEFIKDSQGNANDRVGSEIVATGFMNYAMPLFRYRTGDYACSLERACKCGRGLPLMKLLGGRSRNAIIDKSGNIRYIIGILDKFSDYISQFQYFQREKGRIELRFIERKHCNAAVRESLLKCLQIECGENFEFSLVPVKEIQATGYGKVPLVVSETR